MAQMRHRINLSAANFPFSQTFFGQSVIVGRQDQNFNRQVDSNADSDKDRGLPQVFYCHNVVPTGQGFQSVGYNTRIAAMTPAAADFDSCFTLRDVDDNRFLFVPAGGKNYIWDSAVFEWADFPFTSAPDVNEKTQVTVAYIRGITYICYANYGVFKYNTTDKTFDAVTLAGLTMENILGICAAQGYMIAWDKTSVAWSTPVDELDFVPDITTGAGGGNVYDLRANIVCCLPINNGFVAYTKANAVGASFTGNTRFPFSFKEVSGSGGINSLSQVSHDDNLGAHYAWTNQGFQVINKSDAKQQFPEITDFLAGFIFEDFDVATYTFTTEYVTNELEVKVTVCNNRYVVVSYGKYGEDVYSHALVYDLTFKRWGKLRIDHIDCFDFVAPNLYGQITYQQLLNLGTLYTDLYDVSYDELWLGTWSQFPVPKRSIGFLLPTGEIKTANFDIKQSNNLGVIILGKYQVVRDHWTQLHMIEVESVQPTASDFAVRVLPSLDGKNFETAVTPTSIESDNLYRRYGVHNTAKSQSVVFSGTFYLNSCQLWLSQGGQF